MLPMFSTFQLPTRVVFGAGQLAELGEHVGRLPARKYLVVTDGILAKLGFVDRVREGLEAGGLAIGAVFDGVTPNSETAQVEAAAAAGRAAGCDGVIGLGGGSAMDTAKAVAILLTAGEKPLLEFQGAQILDQLLEDPIVPLVAVPTTAGTGSEVTNCAVVLDEASSSKVTFLDDMLLPAVAVLDPDLTRDLPGRIAAATGMDALTHAVEAYVDVQHGPFSDALALEAIRLIHGSLIPAVENGKEDDEARAAMMMAATLAGVAFTHSMVGIVHGISHALGGIFHAPHGEANAVILPHGMRFNLEAEEERFARLGRELGIDPGLAGAEAAQAAVEAVIGLRARCGELAGLPVNLRELEVPKDRFGEVAEKAMEDGSMLYNPVPVDEEAVLGVLEAAY